MNGLSMCVCVCMWVLLVSAVYCILYPFYFVALIHYFINDAHESRSISVSLVYFSLLLLLFHFVVAYNFINKYHFSHFSRSLTLFLQRLATKSWTIRDDDFFCFFHSKAHTFIFSDTFYRKMKHRNTRTDTRCTGMKQQKNGMWFENEPNIKTPKRFWRQMMKRKKM